MNHVIKSVKRIIYQLLTIMSKKQKKKAFIVFVSMIITSVLELLGVSIIYPFFQIVLNSDNVKDKFYLKWLYTVAPSISNRTVLFILGIAVSVIFIMKNAVALWLSYLQNKFAAEFQRDEATEMLDSYMKLPYLFFINTNSAELLRGINVDTTNAYNILLFSFQIMSEVLTVIFLGVFLIYTDWVIAVGSLLVVSFCALVIILGVRKKIKRAGLSYRQAVKDRNKYSYQAITGIKEITVLDRRDLFVKKYNEAAKNMAQASLTNQFMSSVPDRVLEGVCIAGIMCVVCLRIISGVEMASFIPVVGTFAMGAFKILPSISKISSRINNIVFNLPGLDNCYKIITSARNRDYEFEEGQLDTSHNTSATSNDFCDCLKIRNVSWKYQAGTNEILQNLSMTIKKGEFVAFIGASGAGKTTLADIIMGLLKPQSGSVEADGVDVFSNPHKWSKIIGYVPQAVFLIDDTIRANIAFGIPDNMVKEDKVWSSLEQAQLKSFVESLPDGLDTIVGERGIKLSGGQRQRIAIARALYEDPDILVLDEATSSLDTDTETAVMEAIDLLQGHKTLIIVAHRLTTIKNCDKIYEIKEGKAVLRKKSEVID